MNEKMCPELLEHHMEFVDVMLEQLKELEVMISQATSKTDIRVAAYRYFCAATVYKFVCFATQRKSYTNTQEEFVWLFH